MKHRWVAMEVTLDSEPLITHCCAVCGRYDHGHNHDADCSGKCPRPATVKQQLSHATRLRALAAGLPPYLPSATERCLCAVHADRMDPDWILAPVPYGQQGVSIPVGTKCQWITEEGDEG